MFYITQNNKIILTKGDTATIKISVVDLEGKPYYIKPTDVVTMTVKRTESEQTASISKTANEQHIFIIFPNDTKELVSGVYVYDVQLETEAGNVYTIIPTSFFELLEEIG